MNHENKYWRWIQGIVPQLCVPESLLVSDYYQINDILLHYAYAFARRCHPKWLSVHTLYIIYSVGQTWSLFSKYVIIDDKNVFYAHCVGVVKVLSEAYLWEEFKEACQKKKEKYIKHISKAFWFKGKKTLCCILSFCQLILSNKYLKSWVFCWLCTTHVIFWLLRSIWRVMKSKYYTNMPPEFHFGHYCKWVVCSNQWPWCCKHYALSLTVSLTVAFLP